MQPELRPKLSVPSTECFEMDVEEIAVMVYLASKKRKNKKKRFWIHPLLCERHYKGLFQTYFTDLKQHNDKFFNYLRMSKSSFDELFQKISHSITGTKTNFRPCISPEEKLVFTLRYLASGCSFRELSHSFRVGHTTVRDIVYEVCVAIWQNVKDMAFPKLNKDKWLEISEGFLKNTQFPNCIGAVDGKHIRIIQPAHTGSLYHNYKNYFSVVLMAICDADYKFISIDVGAYGKCSDSSVFKNTKFYEKLTNNELSITEKRSITETGVPLPFVIVGDEAFSLSEHLMRPYAGRNLVDKKRIFNYRLSHARRYIECSFGILANKRRIFHRPIDVRKEFAVAIIKACCVLLNYVRERDGFKLEDTLHVPVTMEEIPTCPPSRGNRTSTQDRDRFAISLAKD